MKIAGITASAVGNHECDMKSADFFNEVPNMPTKLLACNVKAGMTSKIAKYIQKSCIQDVNGTKYGIIGTIPSDLISRIKYGKVFQDQDIQPADINETISAVQAEVNKLKSQGVNKIILLSHSGYGYDKKIAQNTEGIDVILGGHSHNLIKGITNGENLLYSKSGEPVIITQAGRDGKQFGVLNVEFNDKGVITKAQNNLGKTDAYPRNLIARNQFENILGKPEVVGTIKSAEAYPEDAYGHENAHCDFIVDAMRKELNTDIAVMNSANIRGQFEQGRIDTRDLSIISPFANKVAVIQASEDEIVNAIKSRAKASMASHSHRPGIVQVSGLKYKFNKQGDLLSMDFVDKNGNATPIDINNPRKDKIYTIASDDYCINSKDMGLGLAHRYENAIKKFDYDKDIVVGEYIKHQQAPVEIKSDNRIELVG